eukprot:m.99041 g.99041  ORF g.99041 m.99041 type:complete len:73 (+) comp37025_c0_seq25:865-1083(+)
MPIGVCDECGRRSATLQMHPCQCDVCKDCLNKEQQLKLRFRRCPSCGQPGSHDGSNPYSPPEKALFAKAEGK